MSKTTKRFSGGLLPLAAFVVAAAAQSPVPSPSLNETTGLWEVELPAEYQARAEKVMILLPDARPTLERRLPVLYILPVAGPNGRFGDGLMEARKADLANRHQIICVQPFFTATPWLGNHATDPKNQQESHMLKAVVPVIDRLYHTQANAEGRWLIGFSKSGWAACTLLMRHPDVFGYAAAWDVPFMLNAEREDWGRMGIAENFGTKEQMQQSLPARLATQRAEWLRERRRLVIGVGEAWAGQSVEYHGLLERLGIPHLYRPDLVVKHRWDTGWFAPMADDLVAIARAPRAGR